MSSATQDRLRALVLFATPIVLLAGFLAHPYVANETDGELIATQVSADPERWAWAQLLLVIGMGLTLISTISVRHCLSDGGEQRYSFMAAAMVLVGGILLTAAIGGELTLAAVATAGGDVQAVLAAGDHWFTPLFLSASALFGFGWLTFAVAFYQSPAFTGGQASALVAATVVVGVGTLVPATWGGYLISGGLALVSWRIGSYFWSNSPGDAGRGHPHT